MAKQPTSVCLTAEQKAQIERVREEEQARTGEKPSRNAVIRRALDRGLPAMVDAKAG